jgi:hypothetical protein
MADYPRPTKLGTTPATVGGKPTAQYSSPLSYVGRFVLSDQTIAVQNLGIRTVRARAICRAPNGRLYIGLGEAVGAYGVDKFLSLLTKPLSGPAAIVNAPVSGRGATPLEQVAKPESFWYGESPRSGWTAEDGKPLEGIDVQATLGGFDVDDRGLLYVATRTFGWGISRDTGGAGHMELVYHNRIDNIIGEEVISLKVGNTYYVVLSDGRTALIFDVTDPTKPKLTATRPDKQYGILSHAKHDASKRFAQIGADGVLRVFDYSAFVTSGANAVDVEHFSPPSGKWTSCSFDEAGNLWLVGAVSQFWRLTPSGSGYGRTQFIPDSRPITTEGPMTAGAGLVAFAARAQTGSARPLDIRLFNASGAVPAEIPTGNFFRDFYFAPPADNAKIGQHIALEDMKIITHGGKRYLLLSAMGIGDVYEVDGAVAPVPTTPTTPPEPAQKTCPTCGGSGKVSA